MIRKRAPGTSWDNPDELSLAVFPYELQAAVFKAAVAPPQIIFTEIKGDEMIFSEPINKGLALACKLSREFYLRCKTRHRFNRHLTWVDPGRDIFYLHKDNHLFRSQRPASPQTVTVPTIGFYNKAVVKNIAVDLQYLGPHPRHEALVRLWTIFPALRSVHVLVPKGEPGTPTPITRPDTLVLSDMPIRQIVAAPGCANELWLAVRYQMKKVCGRILETEEAWSHRQVPDVFGHLAGLVPSAEEGEGLAEVVSKALAEGGFGSDASDK
ncbi:uncharacterized protein C8A04DRAFT_36275 [Dichotomopilus funicola]|uniref:Uncharacterized protein n=1 Tax=Dichotomopilus funicola TaxID=1934379 RepID=A0AAN6ZPW1_9PEZI|nr:hypothetical protein C8A04DRAFT_36275 [Dichotomopilus funicola]